ncbi:hypothetical protein GC176_19245 [bacterium]|nr:hypothetical protein [bacterium]
MAGRGRGGSGDPDFGSDSFLDIVANLVGILIILIVLAGLRASQAPLQPDELPGMAEMEAAVPDVSPIEPEPTAESVVAVPHIAVSVPSEPVEPAVTEVPLSEPPPFPGVTAAEAAEQLAALQRSVQQAEAQLAKVDVESAWKETRALQQRLAEQSGRLRSLQADAARKSFLAEQDARLAREAVTESVRLRRRLDDVNLQLQQLSRLDAPTDPIEIRINPIGRRSTGDELFFVIENKQILRIPVKELFELAAGRERSNTSLILRAETQRGVVGPVEGVTFDYEIGMQVQPVSSSSGSISYTNSLVMHGIMHPSPVAPREAVDVALAEGGLLSRALLQADRGSVIRLSVATDSFADARRVAACCRDLGFLVSMNTMEPGEEIRVRFGAGSDAVAQ